MRPAASRKHFKRVAGIFGHERSAQPHSHQGDDEIAKEVDEIELPPGAVRLSASAARSA
jgi:hypothetical protein